MAAIADGGGLCGGWGRRRGQEVAAVSDSGCLHGGRCRGRCQQVATIPNSGCLCGGRGRGRCQQVAPISYSGGLGACSGYGQSDDVSTCKAQTLCTMSCALQNTGQVWQGHHTLAVCTAASVACVGGFFRSIRLKLRCVMAIRPCHQSKAVRDTRKDLTARSRCRRACQQMPSISNCGCLCC